jgi:hypothetical protein
MRWRHRVGDQLAATRRHDFSQDFHLGLPTELNILHKEARVNVRILSLVLFAGVTRLPAGVALLVGEPFGRFGFFNPTGHAAVYLSGVCAETPITLRPCRPGESGVVISRYNRIAGYDWIAIPLLPYLYAVERPEDVPETADAQMIAELRDNYRRKYLQELAPDGPEGEMPGGDWVQLVGAAYDRNIYGYALATTPEDDARLIRHLNSRPNQRRFHLIYRNCADFARRIVNFYYPRAIRRSVIADLGITTPKHAAKSLVNYSQRRPEVDSWHFAVPQVSGVRSSRKVRGVSESLIRTKKYVMPLVVLQPWVAASAAIAYLATGRFNPSRQVHTVCSPADLAACLTVSDDPALRQDRADALSPEPEVESSFCCAAN